MSATYHARKEQGLCPVCGGERSNPEFVLCQKCRGPMNPQRSAVLPNERYRPSLKIFLGLHEWMIQQGKHFPSDYQI